MAANIVAPLQRYPVSRLEALHARTNMFLENRTQHCNFRRFWAPQIPMLCAEHDWHWSLDIIGHGYVTPVYKLCALIVSEEEVHLRKALPSMNSGALAHACAGLHA